MKYSIAKSKAVLFAQENKKPIYIVKAAGNDHYRLIFDVDDLTKRHSIVEEVRPSLPEG